MFFRYKAIDANGQEVDGRVEADSRRDAGRQIEQQGLTVFSLELSSAVGRSRLRNRKPPTRELMITLQELVTLLESGVSVAEAVSSLASSNHHPAIVAAFEQMAQHLRRGESFTAALEHAALPLPWYVIHLARAGELTGKLGRALHDGLEQLEYDQRVLSEFRSALTYPAVLVFSGILAVIIIFIVVVPNFAGILAQGGQDVPWLGQAVISTGVWFNSHLLYVAIAVMGLIAGASSVASNPGARQRLLEWLAQLPMVGGWMVESETGRWATTMSALLENRIELVQAMELARSGVRFEFLKARLGQVTKSVRAGSSLADALAQASAITSTGCDLVRVGERSGALPALLKSLGRLYDTTSRERMNRTVQLIEPLAILLIGGFIGLIITGVMLAITASQDIGI